MIPALHRSKQDRSCSVQLITREGAWNIPFPYEQFRKERNRFQMSVEKNRFGTGGIRLDLHAPGLSAGGDLCFGPFSPIGYDIMGPFRYVPFLECRHSVLSMKHTVNGELCINGVKYHFRDGLGYIEGDRGTSFPSQYAWTQCCFDGGSLMLSVADIPLGPLRFTGIIGVILWQGKEYRLATYLGAKAIRIRQGEIVISQGDAVLSVRLMEKHAHPLFAPVGGAMDRTIHESAACTTAYRFQKNRRTLFDFITPKASFEYEYPC